MSNEPGQALREPADRLFSLVEAATSEASPLGGRVSARMLQILAKADKLPGVVRIGRRLFVTESGLRRFIAAGGAR
jgi:hypothetical protein